MKGTGEYVRPSKSKILNVNKINHNMVIKRKMGDKLNGYK